MVDAYNQEKKEVLKERIYQAYYTAYFYRLDRLSKEDLIDVFEKIDRGEDTEMTDDEMLDAVKRMAGENRWQ